MSYLAKLKARSAGIPGESAQGKALTKPTEGPSVSSVGDFSSHISAANEADEAFDWWSITPPSGRRDVLFSPPATRPDVAVFYPDATATPLLTIEAASDECHRAGTDKTDRSPLPSVLSVPRHAGCESVDDRRPCTTCANLSPSGRCLAVWRGMHIGTARGEYHPVLDVLRRCEGYEPGPDDDDRRSGAGRWPWLIRAERPT
jgi:hypothetical protein